jgi:putative methyltransferase (TIGR04325 family)
VLQYIDDPIRKINEILSVYPTSTIIFDDLVNSQLEDFWTCQRFYGHLVPYHFLNLPEFINSITSLGFHLVQKDNYLPTFSEGWDFRVEDFGESIALDIPKTLIFQNQLIGR